MGGWLVHDDCSGADGDEHGWVTRWSVKGSGAHGIGLSPAEAIERRRCMWPYPRHIGGDLYLIGIAYVSVYALWVCYVAFTYSGDVYCDDLDVSDRNAGAVGTDASGDMRYRPPPNVIVIRRRRHARRRKGGNPASRRRAKCRRFEACIVIWLLCSNLGG